MAITTDTSPFEYVPVQLRGTDQVVKFRCRRLTTRQTLHLQSLDKAAQAEFAFRVGVLDWDGPGMPPAVRVGKRTVVCGLEVDDALKVEMVDLVDVAIVIELAATTVLGSQVTAADAKNS